MMQSQGLGALMPQAAQQMAPQQASPRLTAATNLVSSDAERQILDPRTLAMLKYKDALQAMQAADQMMAAAQPAPMPPTVAERTKLAAEQGIAGLASKLGAGIQQQGNRMQTQQLQQAMSGGLPQLPAPNMAGMAQGGIVGYQEGGDVSQREALIAQFIQSGMDPLAAAEEAARALGLTPQVPSTSYGVGDRTGGPDRSFVEELGSARDVIGDVARNAVSRIPEMPEAGLDDSARDQMEALSQLYTQQLPSGSGLPEISEADLLALTTSEKSSPPVEQPRPSALDTLSPEVRAAAEAALSARGPTPESTRSAAYTGPTSAERRAATAERTEGSLRRIYEQVEQGNEMRQAETELRQTLARAGLQRAEIDQIVAAQKPQNEEPESETQESSSGLPNVLAAITQDAARDAPPTESGGAPLGRLATPELEQIEAEIESDPNAFEQLASWVAENPYDAVSMGLIAIPGIGLAGGLGMRGVSALLRSPAVRRAVQSLYSRANPKTAPIFDAATNTMTRGAAGSARVFDPRRAMFTAGTGMIVGGQAANMMGGDGDGEGLASIPLGPTATQGQAVGTPRVRPAQQGFTPAPESMSGEMREPTPVERLRAAAAENTAQQGGKDAVDALLEEEQQPRAGESASDRDARMRRLIAGLRGFGAQGLGGFAAGAGEEELRQEQEGIAERERQLRTSREDRELGIRDRELTLMNEIRQTDAKNQRFSQVMNLVQGFRQLDDNMQTRMGQSIVAATEDVANRLGQINLALADPRLSNDDREKFTSLKNSLIQEMDLTTQRVTESFGEGFNYRPIVESLLRSVMPAGMGSTATTISPDTLAALEQYGAP